MSILKKLFHKKANDCHHVFNWREIAVYHHDEGRVRDKREMRLVCKKCGLQAVSFKEAKKIGTIEDPPIRQEVSSMSEQFTKEAMAYYQAVANKNYPGMMMLARDVNLPSDIAAKYTPHLIIKEKAFVDASARFMGMATTHRFVILSNHMRNLSEFEHGTNWGLHVAQAGSRFKVLGQHEYHGKTGIFLLHLPNDSDWKVYKTSTFALDEQLFEKAKARFESKVDTAPVPELTTKEWLDRCSFPIGMDDEGNLFDADAPTVLPDGTAVTFPKPPASMRERYIGCLLGGAVGDALGFPIEFLPEGVLHESYGEKGIQTLEQAGAPALISDDTQMSLFAANSWLYRASNRDQWSKTATECAWLGYLEWLGTQGDARRMDADHPKMWLYRDERLHARRAPGNTCLTALCRSADGGSVESPENHSKGCGTVMRAAPYGLMIKNEVQDPVLHVPIKLAIADAALTHGHPWAWRASGWLAGCIFQIVQSERAHECALEDYFSAISLPREIDPQDEMRHLIEKAVFMAKTPSISDIDGIHALGAGWVAEEALAIAVFCAVRYQNDFAAAIRAAVNHAGDSDSTGAICGNIVGAWLGREAVEQAFDLNRLELRDVITTIAEDLYQAAQFSPPKPQVNPAWDQKYRP